MRKLSTLLARSEQFCQNFKRGLPKQHIACFRGICKKSQICVNDVFCNLILKLTRHVEVVVFALRTYLLPLIRQ